MTSTSTAVRRRCYGAPVLDGDQRAMAGRIGVTRVARVTGLDRSGVEVACAVRPGGHVLQVSNGKGDTFAAAAWSALAEAAELWSAERIDEADLAWGTRADLERSCAAWGLGDLGSAGQLADGSRGLPLDALRIAWVRGYGLFDGAPVAIPAQAVHCPPPGAVSLGPVAVRWTSNGMGAHADREQAVAHALLEAVERDQLARALPGGFTEAAIRSRLVDAASAAALLPRTAALLERLDRTGFDAHVFDLAARGGADLGLPVAGALVIDREHGPVPLAAGYACRLGLDEAFHAALLEAVQSRLTDVHGARDDVEPMAAGEVDGLRGAIARVRSQRGRAAIGGPRNRAGARARAGAGAGKGADGKALGPILAKLRQAGVERAAVVDLGTPDLGLHIVKVVVPGFLVSELL